jgi:hypothetical protein
MLSFDITASTLQSTMCAVCVVAFGRAEFYSRRYNVFDVVMHLKYHAAADRQARMILVVSMLQVVVHSVRLTTRAATAWGSTADADD